MLLFGSTFASFVGFGAVGIASEFFTPYHTNSVSMLTMMLANTTMAVGVGAMSGFKFVNYSVVPSISKKYAISEARPIYKIVLNDAFTMYLPFGLFMISFTMLDSFNLFGIVPALLGYGFTFTSMYMKAQTLQVPLWYSRQ